MVQNCSLGVWVEAGQGDEVAISLSGKNFQSFEDESGLPLGAASMPLAMLVQTSLELY